LKGRPLSKSKYVLMSDSEPVPCGKGEKDIGKLINEKDHETEYSNNS